MPIQALELVASLTLSALSPPSNSEVTMIAPASRNETADEPRIAEACQKRAADITAQVDDEAYPIEVMPVGEPRPQSK